MKATVLDTESGKQAVVDEACSFEWAGNDWSCDCNRAKPFGYAVEEEMDRRMREKYPELLPHQSYCWGCKRFLVIAAEMNDQDDYEYTLAELNVGYADELLRAHGVADSVRDCKAEPGRT